MQEKKAIEKYLINPKIKVTSLKLRPRKSLGEISCKWEFKIEGVVPLHLWNRRKA